MLRMMMLVRAFDERMFRAQRQGKTSFYMKSTGEEATSVASTMAIDRADMAFPSYRQQGILIARNYPLIRMMNQIYSNRGDHLLGRQLPIMYSAPDYGFFSRSEEHTSELQSLMRISYAVFCLKKQNYTTTITNTKD